MKIAISGKGGVGKTTLAALLIKYFRDQGKKVLAVDADPDANLALALGIADASSITPLSDMKDMVAERTESTPGKMGGFFKLNPKVDDIPEKFSRQLNGVKLIVMGGVKKGGSGCICPESVLLRTLITHLVLIRDEVVVMDMEAGIEHLGRATARGVDWLIVVVEPGRRSVETALQVKHLAQDLGLTKVAIVGNKIRQPADQEFLKQNLPDLPILGFLPFDEKVIEADLKGRPPYELSPTLAAAAQEIGEKLGKE
ncbi:MAG: carbon monoxide dehydrogenase [Deltaproteobacteria bacterium RBG_13_58_19]|nr:MAG: carbon monoxide dehydrogenase [Deltaproteobacteria bacterium RBG_13_58_19]